jgi:hypothetical protein
MVHKDYNGVSYHLINYFLNPLVNLQPIPGHFGEGLLELKNRAVSKNLIISKLNYRQFHLLLVQQT